jgi:hypothetical protein
MVDRFHKLMTRTLRTLHDLRRRAPVVMVQTSRTDTPGRAIGGRAGPGPTSNAGGGADVPAARESGRATVTALKKWRIRPKVRCADQVAKLQLDPCFLMCAQNRHAGTASLHSSAGRSNHHLLGMRGPRWCARRRKPPTTRGRVLRPRGRCAGAGPSPEAAGGAWPARLQGDEAVRIR